MAAMSSSSEATRSAVHPRSGVSMAGHWAAYQLGLTHGIAPEAVSAVRAEASRAALSQVVVVADAAVGVFATFCRRNRHPNG
ncbi:uncharacterized protein PG986_001828 [Apiospora aurea]|uniref:Uncharacterized protein n=1 Tax=Apiospora aurea TaxID=335848 RepID=A0ABR1QXY7_9PEZI